MLGILSPCLVTASVSAFDPTPGFLKEHHNQLKEISSDEEALRFFSEYSREFLPKKRSSPHASARSKTAPLPPTLQELVIPFMKNLSTLTHIQAYRNQLTLHSQTQEPSQQKEPTLQESWILSNSPWPNLVSTRQLYLQILTWEALPLESLPPDNTYGVFASYFDRSPSARGGKGWIQIFRDKGSAGIQARFQDYREDPAPPQHPSGSSSLNHEHYISHYIHRRLLPIFKAEFFHQSIVLESQILEAAWEQRMNLKRWIESQQQYSAHARLCGTWKWLVHNHQNHGDHKMTMTFFLPDQVPPNHPQPSTITIQGDTVFLRWNFPQGFQEDSLLLSNHDSRLEGTFQNSLGPHGSISGTRLTGCPTP